jgi:CRP/FNR family cyclic AMP-dependent transcriptional regulator
MDTTVFFNYPTQQRARAPRNDADGGLLPHGTAAEWDAVLAATEAMRFHPGDVVLRAGERDRALYILLDGRVVLDGGAELAPPALLGAAAFLDGEPRAAAAIARGHGELARLSWDGYEALAARDPRLGRQILVDVGRELAAQLRAAAIAGWAG